MYIISYLYVSMFAMFANGGGRSSPQSRPAATPQAEPLLAGGLDPSCPFRVIAGGCAPSCPTR